MNFSIIVCIVLFDILTAGISYHAQMDKEFKEVNLDKSAVLVVGDGDFSFSVAFVTRYSDVTLTASTLETDSVMMSKYPNFSNNVAYLRDKG